MKECTNRKATVCAFLPIMGGAQFDQLRGVSQHAPVIAGHRVNDQYESGRFGQPRQVPQLPPDGLRLQQSLPRLLELFLGAERPAQIVQNQPHQFFQSQFAGQRQRLLPIHHHLLANASAEQFGHHHPPQRTGFGRPVSQLLGQHQSCPG